MTRLDALPPEAAGGDHGPVFGRPGALVPGQAPGRVPGQAGALAGAQVGGLAAGGLAAGGLAAAARTVAEHDPYAGDSFQVAVALEISGYTDADARRLGCADLFDLARGVHAMLRDPRTVGPIVPVVPAARTASAQSPAPPAQDVREAQAAVPVPVPVPVPAVPVPTVPVPAQPAAPSRRQQPPHLQQPSRWPHGRQLLRGLLYSVPWVAALVALRVAHVSFWSTITTTQFSSTISLALFFALVLTGAAIQAFARRGTFYVLQGNWPLLSWTARWLIGIAAVVIVVVVVVVFVLLEWVLHAYTPESNRMFLVYGFAIPAMLLGLAPLYMARAFGWLAAASIAGALFLIVVGKVITVGDYLDPYFAMALGVPGIGVVITVAVPAGMAALRRHTAEAATETGGGIGGDLAAVRPPRLSAVLRSVAGYAAYGATFFGLLIADQLVAGGLWEGGYTYSGHYQSVVAVALLVLIPVLAYVIAAQEQLPDVVRHSLATHTVTRLDGVRADLCAFHRRHLATLVVVGVIVAALIAVVMWVLSPHAGPGRDIPNLRPDMPVFCAALFAYLLLAIGAFNSGLLFALNRARVPALSTSIGVVLSLAVGGCAVALSGSSMAAVSGLAAGTGLFCVVTTIVTRRAFVRFDSVYYGAF